MGAAGHKLFVTYRGWWGGGGGQKISGETWGVVKILVTQIKMYPTTLNTRP